jgi:hypothetical protein
MVDKSILFTGDTHDELLGFYFDKFNLDRKDLNPFLAKDKISDYLFRASCRQGEKNLSRRVITIRQNKRRLDKMIKQIEEHTGQSVEELRKLNGGKHQSKGNLKNLIHKASVDEIDSGVQD